MSRFVKIIIAIVILGPLVIFGIKYLTPKEKHVDGVVTATSTQSPEALYATKCAACHGKNGEGSETHPKLIKLTKEQFVTKVKKHSNPQNQGANQVMTSQVSALETKDVEALAAYVGTLPDIPATAMDANTSAKKQNLKFERVGSD